MNERESLSIRQNVMRQGIRMDCVFAGTAYSPERECVRELRLAGSECSEIAEQTGMVLHQVIQFCHELGLPEKGCCHLVPPGEQTSRLCPVCGRIVFQHGRGGRKRFCSAECQREYENRNYKTVKIGRTAVCKNCGRQFTAYCESRGERKFCSRNCYFEYRYGMKSTSD